MTCFARSIRGMLGALLLQHARYTSAWFRYFLQHDLNSREYQGFTSTIMALILRLGRLKKGPEFPICRSLKFQFPLVYHLPKIKFQFELAVIQARFKPQFLIA
jgi:hypothetical protein